MAFDPDLAQRLRAVLAAAGQAPAEKKMFGGLSFLVRGNMCCGVRGDELLVHLGPASTGGALAYPATRPFDMGRGPSPGWVLVTPDGIATDDALAGWVHQALAFVSPHSPPSNTQPQVRSRTGGPTVPGPSRTPERRASRCAAGAR